MGPDVRPINPTIQTMKFPAIMRPAAILILVGFGIHSLVSLIPMWSSPSNSIVGTLFAVLFAFIMAGVPFLSAYLAFRRDYVTLTSLWIGIGAVAVYFLTNDLMRRTGIQDRVFRLPTEGSWGTSFPLLSTLLIIIFPFWIARVFFRLTHRIAARFRLPQVSAK